MNRKQLLSLAAATAILVTGCAPSLTEGGKRVRLTWDMGKVTMCRPVNTVSGRTSAGNSLEWSRKRLRNNAAALGADTVLVIHEFGLHGSRSSGMAYVCGE